MAGGGSIGIGVSGLLAAQRALATTSQNIANANTEGYSVQKVDFQASQPQVFGNGVLGTGVVVSNVQRSYDAFNTLKVRDSTANFNQMDKFHELASQLDDLLANDQAGMMPAIQGFFDAIQNVSNDPSSLPARQVLLSESESLELRFQSMTDRFSEMRFNVNSSVTGMVNEINSLATSVATVNGEIADIIGSGVGQPNDLLDRREVLLTQLSEIAAVQTIEQDDGSLNVFIGNGQVLVAGNNARALEAQANIFDPQRIEIGYQTGAGVSVISDQIKGGSLGGLLGFRRDVLDDAENSLGYLAVGMSETLNAQHQLGSDLNGQLGGDLFVSLVNSAPKVLNSSTNTGFPAAQINVSIDDVNTLSSGDYKLVNDGGNYTLTRLNDGHVFTLNTFPAGVETVDGLTLSLNGGTNIADGDRFLIRPARDASEQFSLQVKDPRLIAAANPVLSKSGQLNTGTGQINQALMVDRSLYQSDNYTISLSKSTLADANGGATLGLFVDDPLTANNLRYDLVINGTVVYSQNEADAPLADKVALAAVINDDVATTGVRAVLGPLNNVLYLINDPQNASPITVSEQLVDTNAVPVPLDALDSFSGYFGSTLTGAAPSAAQSYALDADSYVVTNSSGANVASGTYVADALITFDGIETSISGLVNAGDLFLVNHNNSGVGDNRNMLKLAELQEQLSLDGGNSSYSDVYNQMVVEVGIKTRQADINREAFSGLLNQALDNRDSLSGVNLDEEAANLLRFQQAYQASAQVIRAMDSLFSTLLDSVRR